MYKLSTCQYQLLLGNNYDGQQLFNPVVDVNGDFFISKEEIESCSNPDFEWVKDLVISDYVAPKVEL
jgi:hypothetical protein